MRRNDLIDHKVAAEEIEYLKGKNEKLENERIKLVEEKYMAIIEEKDKCINIVKEHSKIVNTQNISNQNIDNSRTTNYLNITFPNMMDIDTFMSNLRSSHMLSNEQTGLLLESFKTCGLISYGNCLSKTLKDNCYKQMKDMNKNNEIKMLPMVTTDSNLRSHKEMHKDGWTKVDSDKKINEIISISNDQVYKNHQEQIYLDSKDRKKVGNIIKKDHGINELQKQPITSDKFTIKDESEFINEYTDRRSDISVEDDMYIMEGVTEMNSNEIEENVHPEYIQGNSYNMMIDCGRNYLYDENDNVFNPDNFNYVGRRIYDNNFKLFYIEYSK